MPKVLYHIEDLKNILKREKPSNVYLVTSNNIAKKLKWVFPVLAQAGVFSVAGASKANIIYVPDGESAKTWNSLRDLLVRFSLLGLDRSSIVVVLGGGTTGDLVGFACSVYMRGIRYIQIPTTLVAQVDSAHGAKTGIDFLSHKNQIGSIYEPLSIIVDERVLKTLTKPQIIDGLGEIIKCGLIKDSSILELLKGETVDTLLKSAKLPSIIKKTIAVKDFYTSGDMTDKADRQMLNFGHTIGHAIELANNFSHGYAVLIGMLLELDFTNDLGITDEFVGSRIICLFNDLGIDLVDELKIDSKSIVHDKKINGDTIMLPVVLKEGDSKLIKIKTSELVKYIENL